VSATGDAMNCQSVRNRILSLPDPREVPDALRAHLDGCADCQRWWHQAARLERLLSQLPAPPAPDGKKEALIDELTAAGPVIRTPVTAPRPLASPGLALLRRNWKSVAALAASVLVVLGGWLVWPRSGPPPVAVAPPQHPLLAKVVQRSIELTRAGDPETKLRGYGELADDLSAETRSLARVASEGDLKVLARCYEKVVKGGIVGQAGPPDRTLTPDERKKRAKLLDGLAERLAAAAQDTEAVAREAPPDRQRVLQEIANTARSGQTELRKLANEGA